MAVLDHREVAFEHHIVGAMLATKDWIGENPDQPGDLSDFRGYDATLGLYPSDLIAFLKATQPRKFERVVAQTGSDEAAERSILARLAEQLDDHGCIGVLRGGFDDRGARFKLAFFPPAHGDNPDAQRLYQANRLRVVRQVRFDPGRNDSVDLVLFVNGVPTATAELKNRFTGQGVMHAIRQYKTDRDPGNLLFGRRAFVHFAVDGDLAYMTTRLAWGDTEFLPFNQGSGGTGNPGHKGNPPSADGHATSYLWREVWDREAWLDLIERFVFDEEKRDKRGNVVGKRTIFPRYHQWDVVRRCREDARANGAGHNYLIQHSAGSGKSKEIAWLAHDLSELHDDQDRKVFSKVIVITDRRVLDQQLQRQVLAFEQVRGVVQSIERDSAQLREALTGPQARIIVTTLQKFPFVLRQLDEIDGGADGLAAGSYAVIVDEAHSSQTGEAAADLKQVLGNRTIDDLDLDPDEVDGVPVELLAQLAARGTQPNLSFFAFTATPKGRTLELFGRKGAGGRLSAFHTYSMQQAIDEGFILDVLTNYITYQQLYRLETQAGEELEVPKGKAARRIARYAEFHPYALDQKATVIVEHFETHVRRLLGNEAKAMVVTDSRAHAVRYKRAIDRVIERDEHEDVKALVAFSGEVKITDPADLDYREAPYSEPQMNAIDGQPLAEKQLPAEFAKPAYGVLIVAEKYQTGFDEPKLCAMYVDKTLTGINAVQTLSRLNRTHPGKEQVYVLDFVNDPEHIRQAFEPYYTLTEATPTGPNVLFDAERKLRSAGVITDEMVRDFCTIYFAPEEADHSALARLTQPAVNNVNHMTQDERDQFKDRLDKFTRLYSFLSQTIPWTPPETHQLYVFSKFLAARLYADTAEGGLNIDGSIQMTHYRVEQTGVESPTLGDEEPRPLTAIPGKGTGPRKPAGEIPKEKLTVLVHMLNERFGSELTEDDAVKPLKLLVDHFADDEAFQEQALTNPYEDVRRGKDEQVVQAAAQLGEVTQMVLQQILDDPRFRNQSIDAIIQAAYEEVQARAAQSADAAEPTGETA